MEKQGLQARAAALAALGAVLRRRRPLDAALEQALAAASLAPRDAGFARAIASETMRRFGQIEALLREYVPRPPAPHRAGAALEILMMGICELLFLKVAAHAAVDAANDLAARDSKAKHFKPLINAVLRRVTREGESAIAKQDAPRLNTADWLWPRWCETYGEAATRAMATAHLVPPPLDIMTKAAVEIPGAVRLPGNVLRLGESARVEDLPGFADGTWWVQDLAATFPVRLLGDVNGKTVIDLCAAPGGKTAQLASTGAHAIAVEREHERIRRLRENLERLHLNAQIIEADVRDFHPERRAPFVLLDAPCSATGTIRRHPELPWIKSAADVNACVQNAGELLDAAAQMVAQDGLLVFAVCSLECEEGIEQVEDFLRRNDSFAREPVAPQELFGMSELISPQGDLRTQPCYMAEIGGMDGFYAARLRRR